MVAVDEEACSPSVRQIDVHLTITKHPTREFDYGSELTPANDVGSIIDEGCVGLVGSDKLLLILMVLPRPPLLLAVCEVEEGAPAPTPDSVMLLDHPLEVRPCF
jgi:hypothetical protein